MNFIAICLHCLDMRDFHSYLRETPFLDELKKKSVFISGRGHSHHHTDSLNPEMTGVWTARFSDSELTQSGFKCPSYYNPSSKKFPKTVIEYLEENGYDIFTNMNRYNTGSEDFDETYDSGSWAVQGGLTMKWLAKQPERLKQFSTLGKVKRQETFEKLRNSKKFYAHYIIRETHRPWGQRDKLFELTGQGLTANDWPWDAYCARKAAIEKPDEFASLRRTGLSLADQAVQEIFENTKDIEDVAYIIYSNHGEMYDFLRYSLNLSRDSDEKPIWQQLYNSTSHGSYPYEVLYSNMQMWIIPGYEPHVMTGVGRLIDFPATILDLSGIPVSQMDGKSMLPDFQTGKFENRERFAENVLGRGCVSMVREDNMKFISTGIFGDDASVKYRSNSNENIDWGNITVSEFDGPSQHRLAVFDLNSDPYERVNLIDSKVGQEVLLWAVNKHKELKEGNYVTFEIDKEEESENDKDKEGDYEDCSLETDNKTDL